jgi:hypothetical protein
MKRIVSAALTAVMALSLVALRQPACAQDPAKEKMSKDVTEVLSKFVEAVNRGDMALASTMLSTKPGLSTISDGTITHGPDAIRNRLNRVMGLQGKYQITLGALNIANVNGLALVTGPYTVHVKGRSASAKGKGAVTFLLEYQAKKNWVITHIHRSLSEATATSR